MVARGAHISTDCKFQKKKLYEAMLNHLKRKMHITPICNYISGFLVFHFNQFPGKSNK